LQCKRHGQLDRYPPVQPHVLNATRFCGGRCGYNLFTPRNSTGNFCELSQRAENGAYENTVGIAQTGKAFRNEIVARQFIFRMREFEQMEMQFFVRPGTEGEWYKYWKEARLQWHLSLGIDAKKYRYHDHVKLAHYAKEACDIEYEFPFGFKEVEGIHSRSDFDLTQHQQFSKKKMQYFDTEINQNYVPYVVENIDWTRQDVPFAFIKRIRRRNDQQRRWNNRQPCGTALAGENCTDETGHFSIDKERWFAGDRKRTDD
jgi:hypothetical protein